PPWRRGSASTRSLASAPPAERRRCGTGGRCWAGPVPPTAAMLRTGWRHGRDTPGQVARTGCLEEPVRRSATSRRPRLLHSSRAWVSRPPFRAAGDGGVLAVGDARPMDAVNRLWTYGGVGTRTQI